MRQLKITKSITNRESASLDKYLQEIGKEDLITVEEEVELAQRIKKGDQAALEKLTRANLRFVVSVAKQYQNQGLSLPDLINEGKIGKISEKENGNLMLRYEDINSGKLQEAEHDMVILSVGVLPNEGVNSLFENKKLELDPYNFVGQSDLLASPAKTSIEGVFVAGTASGPMDIPDSRLSAGAASSEAISYLIQIP